MAVVTIKIKYQDGEERDLSHTTGGRCPNCHEEMIIGGIQIDLPGLSHRAAIVECCLQCERFQIHKYHWDEKGKHVEIEVLRPGKEPNNASKN